ncbi:MAG: exodeoxyribonuclease VII small subunit [Desulfarculus sp.]|nr:MAG: exodeoxyribonuclease VII small subunit [Desulfarculus sp.]
MAKPKKEPGFEQSLQRLEQIVERLESEELELEESLALFEEGVKLAEACNRRLDEAEKKVSLLLKDREGALSETPFAPEAEE